MPAWLPEEFRMEHATPLFHYAFAIADIGRVILHVGPGGPERGDRSGQGQHRSECQEALEERPSPAGSEVVPDPGGAAGRG